LPWSAIFNLGREDLHVKKKDGKWREPNSGTPKNVVVHRCQLPFITSQSSDYWAAEPYLLTIYPNVQTKQTILFNKREPRPLVGAGDSVSLQTGEFRSFTVNKKLWLRLGLWCFNNISVLSWSVSFIGGGNWSSQRKSLTCCKSHANFIT
jgi:hypothetical protein